MPCTPLAADRPLTPAPLPLQRSGDKAPVYCPQLGLAIESLKDGITLDQLWSIL